MGRRNGAHGGPSFAAVRSGWTVLAVVLVVAAMAALIPEWAGRAAQAPKRDSNGVAPATESTYRHAVLGYLDCVKKAGYATVGPVRSPFDGKHLLRDVVPAGDPTRFNATLDRCDAAFDLAEIEPAFTAARPSRLAPELRPAAAACLLRQGIRVATDEIKGDYRAAVALAVHPTDFNACMTDAARRLFPELPAEVVIFY